jgi:hypothetical protein
MLLEARDEETGEGMTPQQLRDEAITILRPLAAGTATFDEKDDATRLLERLNRR